MIILPDIVDGEDKSSPFANCLRNNYRHLKKWAKRTQTDAFRIYDRELGNYPLAIDFYAGRYCVHYFSPQRQSDDPPPEFVIEVSKVLNQLLGAKKEDIFWRTRAKNKATRQYEKIDDSQQFFTVLEYGVKFKINLTDYLDTGLFLDHRQTRQLIAAQCAGKRVLNLFAYTCAFSVHAAMAGATFTKSVDMSNTYTAWGRANFLLNTLSLRDNEIVRADCLRFLDQEAFSKVAYDVIIVDPPTISRSKKMEQFFDVKVDYIDLLSKALRLLAPQGILLFSTNARKFTFDASHFAAYSCQEITHKTIPPDFKDRTIHRCWQLGAKAQDGGI